MSRHLTADVAIIGGGLVGCSAALALRQQQLSVVLLEQGWCGAQASGVNYGGVRRQGRAPIQLPLAQRAQEIWQRLPELIGSDGEYTISGHLKLARSEADMASLEEYKTQVAPFGLELDILDRDTLRRRYPWLGDKLAGASFCAQDGHANPRLVAAGFALAAQRQGATVCEGEAVEDVTFDGAQFLLQTRSGLQLKAKYLLNCAGAWGAKIAAQFGEDVPEYCIHPNMLVTEPIAPLIAPNIGMTGGGFYARQVARGNVIIGGGRGTGALDIGANRPESGTTFDTIKIACDIIPALANTLVIRSWTGVEGAFADHQPVIGASQTTPGLLHAFGFSGSGFQLAPAVGEVLCDLVTNGSTATPIAPFSIDRFKQ